MSDDHPVDPCAEIYNFGAEAHEAGAWNTALKVFRELARTGTRPSGGSMPATRMPGMIWRSSLPLRACDPAGVKLG